jgi:hypothetical protein
VASKECVPRGPGFDFTPEGCGFIQMEGIIGIMEWWNIRVKSGKILDF